MNKHETIHLVTGFIVILLLWYSWGARITGYESGYRFGLQDGQEKGRIECMCGQSNWYYNIGRILNNEAIQQEAKDNLKRCKEWGKVEEK